MLDASENERSVRFENTTKTTTLPAARIGAISATNDHLSAWREVESPVITPGRV